MRVFSPSLRDLYTFLLGVLSERTITKLFFYGWMFINVETGNAKVF